MTYTLKSIRERRLSTKIISGKIRRYSPKWLYDVLLDLRFIFFRNSCSDSQLPSISYSDGSWVNRNTTADLRAIELFLAKVSDPIDVFQAGVGNSSLFGAIENKARRLVGITIIQDEIDYARKLYPKDFGIRYHVGLLNKYTETLTDLAGQFDFVVDNDLSSYACCKTHFNSMLKAYHSMLKPKGAILVGLRGLGYFDSGFGLTEHRMKAIAATYQLKFEKGDCCYFLRSIY